MPSAVAASKPEVLSPKRRACPSKAMATVCGHLEDAFGCPSTLCFFGGLAKPPLDEI
jgi:hypothetical protein